MSSLFDSTSRKAGEVAAQSVGKRREQILGFLRDHGPAAIFEIAAHLGCFDHQISGRFGELERDGLIVKTGQRKPKPETGCEAELYALRDAAPIEPTRLERIADQLGYPPTLIIDDGKFQRGALCEDDLPGVPYIRCDGQSLAEVWRVAQVECDGCGRPLKCVEEIVAGQKRKTFRCGTPSCNRTWHVMLIKEPGQQQTVALVMRHL